MKKSFGLLGEKLGHSFSPLIHGYLGDYDYPLYEVPADSLDAFLEDKEFDGINVTIPYKQAVLPYCAALSDEARTIGSVNTIIKGGDGLLYGYNTDHHGFRVMLERGNIDPNGKKVLVLGNGGAARTVRAVLAGLGALEIVTVSRSGENHYGNIRRHYDADIIVNATPVGMYPHNGGSPICLDGFTRLTGVADLIYNPMRTKLLLDAGRAGAYCANGLTMLVAQAEMASRLFQSGPARPELVDEISETIKKRTRSIALIGMPGCGKSTVGGLLSKEMGLPFADTDELIKAAAGKSIPEIFSGDGEEAFRRLETQILGEETKKCGIVIATGGGIVTRPENLDLLRQNSLIVFLKRDLAELNTFDRPLSLSLGIQALAEKRLPLYEAWGDLAIRADSTPERTVARIMEAI